ncbi:MAG: LytTR family transcriptional regulator [Altererythrobacter sp.]|nr:LytTR family transcriptional regulator [Altererythrobacter sp.]
MLGIAVAAWVSVTLISAIQGQLLAVYHGRPQDWWGTLGYTAAIFSVWAMLALPIVLGANLVLAGARSPVMRTALLATGYPIAMAGHVLLFSALFWPIYGTGAATPFAMMRPVLLANLDKSTFAYVALIAAVWLFRHFRARNPDSVEAAGQGDGGLSIRVAGGMRFIRWQEIDWIAAAGDYAEVHAGGRSLLTDRSLAALIDQLPAAAFARIHRGAIVRLDRIRDVRSLGRGDARVILTTGDALRLSRRYRDKLGSYLTS